MIIPPLLRQHSNDLATGGQPERFSAPVVTRYLSRDLARNVQNDECKGGPETYGMLRAQCDCGFRGAARFPFASN